MADRNVARLEGSGNTFWIGVNLGDVVADCDDLHGNGAVMANRMVKYLD